MQTQPDVQARPSTRQPRRWLPAAAAVAVVAIAFATLSRDGGILSPPSPVEIAEQYLEARNAWDADAARDLLADDANLSDMPIIAIDELDLGFEALRVSAFEYEPFECTNAGVSGTATDVRCTYMMDTRLSQIIGYPPVAGSFDFLIEDGRIVRLINNFPFSRFSPNVYEPWLEWLLVAHPDAFDQLYIVESGYDTPRLTPESLALMPGYLAEYEEYVKAGGGS